MQLKTLIFICFIFTLGGCVATGPNFKPYSDLKNEEALIYVFRPQTHALSLLTSIIELDGQNVVKLENNGYAAIPIKSGKHTIRQYWKAGVLGSSEFENKPISRDLSLKAGETVYLKIDAEYSASSSADIHVINMHYEWNFYQVLESDAIEKLSQCKLTNLEPRL